ncbi:hypothetical protein COL83_17180 [Bacillus wiedmannii]|nr:hypothetical protein COL83_17180 [Bacillus wiedmannii]
MALAIVLIIAKMLAIRNLCPLSVEKYNCQRYKIFIMGVIKKLSLMGMGYRQHFGKGTFGCLFFIFKRTCSIHSSKHKVK